MYIRSHIAFFIITRFLELQQFALNVVDCISSYTPCSILVLELIASIRRDELHSIRFNVDLLHDSKAANLKQKQRALYSVREHRSPGQDGRVV